MEYSCVVSHSYAMDRKISADRRRAALQDFMRVTGLRPAPWARRAGVSPNGIYNFLRGRSDSLSQRVIEALAEAAGRPVSQIIGETVVAARSRIHPQPAGGATVRQADGDKGTAGEAPSPADFVMIRQFDAPISAGGGFIVEDDNPSGGWPMARAYVGQFLGVRSPAGLVAVEVRGDSMEPTLRSGDRVIVDTNDRLPSPAGIFVLWDGIGTVIKRVEHVQGSDPTVFRIISDNTLHRPYELPAEEANVVGRVICLTRRL